MDKTGWEQPWPTRKLSAEETLNWLDSCRRFMFEIWKNNPNLRKIWEKLKAKGF